MLSKMVAISCNQSSGSIVIGMKVASTTIKCEHVIKTNEMIFVHEFHGIIST